MGDVGLVIIGSVLTLFGGLVVHMVRRKDEHAAWLRERQLEAYSEFLSAAHQAWASAAAHFMNDAATVRDMNRCVHEVGRAESAIRLLGPDAVGEAAEELWRVLHRLVGELASGSPAVVEHDDLLSSPTGASVAVAERAFVAAASAVVGDKE